MKGSQENSVHFHRQKITSFECQPSTTPYAKMTATATRTSLQNTSSHYLSREGIVASRFSSSLVIHEE